MFLRAILPLYFASLAAAATLHVQQAGFKPAADGLPAGWRTWAARPEIAPRTFVDLVHYRNAPGSLAISGNTNAAEYGGWGPRSPTREVVSLRRLLSRGGCAGRAAASGLAPGLGQDRRNARRTAGLHLCREPAGAWTRVSVDAPAPESATSVKLQLYLQNAPYATIWWNDISLEEIAAPGARTVHVASINLRPRDTHSAEQSVNEFLAVIRKSVSSADVILLPEGITVVGTGKHYPDVAESIPGPTTERLAEVAREKNAYIVAGIYEREGAAIYNTAVLIDRTGRFIGKYRKVYLPREEIEGGLTPGNDYPVFRTDFGRVGMMICWDLQYADPARALALRGAEIILMPIWGGNETLAKARAIENQVFLVSSGYDFPTSIVDPTGELLAITRDQGTVASATIDLNRRYVDTWLGDMRERFMKELRLDVKVE
jgi:predicted amidohydrolase